MNYKVSVVVFLLNVCALSVCSAVSNHLVVRKVSSAKIAEAMALEQGYDATATTNVARFQSAVLLRLARTAQQCDPTGAPLLIGHAEWFEAFLHKHRLTRSEAPTFARLAYEHQQDQIVDYRPGRVISAVKRGEKPVFAVNVKVTWPETETLPDKYSFEDTLSTPNLKVTNHRVITYRLLDFGDMIAVDQIRGLTGRPTTGLLGFLFRFIGEGLVVQSRMMVSNDGLLIARARSKKGVFGLTTTVTVHPNGKMEKGLPAGRKDLRLLEKRLKERFEIEYVPFTPENRMDAQ